MIHAHTMTLLLSFYHVNQPDLRHTQWDVGLGYTRHAPLQPCCNFGSFCIPWCVPIVILELYGMIHRLGMHSCTRKIPLCTYFHFGDLDIIFNVPVVILELSTSHDVSLLSFERIWHFFPKRAVWTRRRNDNRHENNISTIGSCIGLKQHQTDK